MPEATELYVNGAELHFDGDAQQMLLFVVREHFGLTGSKIGCGEGECGACTMLVDDQPTRACITPLVAVAGKRIVTIEGLAQDDQLHPLQQAFLDVDALQCGYCTAGMIVSGVGLLLQNLDPSQDEIIHFMQGNICRCGTYPRIICAIQRAATALRTQGGQQ